MGQSGEIKPLRDSSSAVRARLRPPTPWTIFFASARRARAVRSIRGLHAASCISKAATTSGFRWRRLLAALDCPRFAVSASVRGGDRRALPPLPLMAQIARGHSRGRPMARTSLRRPMRPASPIRRTSRTSSGARSARRLRPACGWCEPRSDLRGRAGGAAPAGLSYPA